MKKLTLSLALIAASMTLTGNANAADGAALYQSKTCVACHGAEGKKPLLPQYPMLAGQNKEYAVQQMKDIKSGARSNGLTAAMKGIMHLVTDEEIEAIADWLAGLE